MQTYKKAILFCVAVAALGLASAASAVAGGWQKTSCSSFNPNIVVLEGPCPVADPNQPECGSSGDYTGVMYQNTGSYADHLATLVTRNNIVSVATGNQSYDACDGDPVTGLGKLSCHEKAVKVNPADQTTAFWIVVDGYKQGIETSVVAKKGSCVKSFPVVGLGLGSAVAPVTETLTHGQCAVVFTLDSASGSVLNAQLTQDSIDAGCNLINDSVENLEVKLGSQTLGFGQFGSGYVQTGSTSCTTRIIGGRVYSWGSPCPE
jgi:hypothetical protein